MAAQVQQKRDFAGYRLRAVPPNTRESPSRRQRPLPPCVENRCFEDLAGSDEDVADIASEASEYLRITESRGTVASADLSAASYRSLGPQIQLCRESCELCFAVPRNESDPL